ncbi:cytochrome P450 [Actinomadura hibisca]|uniref:cytochrome P450 n=1 Tax=Actinomadura hibisca TaxID=68565 RepID=UPI0008376A8E|nr:cytochrome P450 [Actinomadura hibisca]
MSGPDILSAEYDADPYPFYSTMRESFSLYRHEQTGFYMVSRYEDVAYALTSDPFTTRHYDWQIEPVAGARTIGQMDGAEHAHNRRMIGTPMRGRALQDRVVPRIERTCRELIDGFRTRGTVELMAEFAAHVPISTIVAIMDLPQRDLDRFRVWYRAFLDHMGNFGNDPAVESAGRAARAAMTEYLRPVIRERRARPGADLISAMCAVQPDGGLLSDQQIQANCAILFAGSSDTTMSAIANTIRSLLENPRYLELARRDRTLIDRMHHEAIRLRPPTHLTLRYTEEEAEVSGGVIPAGSTVACVVAAANRDPARFLDPDTYDPFRAESDPARQFTSGSSIVTFGKGRHFCLGALVVQNTITIAVGQLLDAMHDIRLVGGVTLTESGVFTRALTSFPLEFTPA